MNMKYKKKEIKEINLNDNELDLEKEMRKIDEKNGIIKEYNEDGQLIFEGEYLNGIRNGKGKEYLYNGTIIFEGEYLKGEKNGRGKKYYYDGTLIFEGEYLNGKRNGKEKNIIQMVIYIMKVNI